MSSLDEIFQSLPISQIAQQVGADEQDVQHATAAILPALVGGLQANAQDPAGAASIEQALTQHDGSLLDGGIDVSQVDQAQGAKIASHIFGSNQDQVVNALGGLGGPGVSSGLVQKLLPILAPIVMAYLAKQVFGGITTGQQQSSGGGILGNILGGMLGGHSQGGQVQTQSPVQLPQGMPSIPVQQDRMPQQSSGGIDDIINSAIAAGSPQGQAQQGGLGGGVGGGLGGMLGGGTGSILGSVLGGMLGGGRR